MVCTLHVTSRSIQSKVCPLVWSDRKWNDCLAHALLPYPDAMGRIVSFHDGSFKNRSFAYVTKTCHMARCLDNASFILRVSWMDNGKSSRPQIVCKTNDGFNPTQ